MCPECKKPLVIFELHGVEVDHCLHCRGTWLGTGELEQICELAGFLPSALVESLRRARSGAKSRRHCPRCHRYLRAITLGSEPPVELDECPRGHGLWFDRGELRATVHSLYDNEEGAVGRFLGEVFRFEIDSSPH